MLKLHVEVRQKLPWNLCVRALTERLEERLCGLPLLM